MRIFAVVFCFFAIAILAAIGRLALHARHAAVAMSCGNNVKQLALAIDNYYGAYGVYPSPDFGGHSWRIRVLGFVEATSIASNYRYDHPWDSETNITLDSRPLPTKLPNELVVYGPPGTYCCPLESQPGHGASYRMLVGPSAFGKPGGFRSRDEITDDPRATIVLAESKSLTSHWLAPEDLDTTKMSFVVNDDESFPSISSDHPRGPTVLFADGAVHRLAPSIDPRVVQAMATINGGESVNRDELVLNGDLLTP